MASAQVVLVVEAPSRRNICPTRMPPLGALYLASALETRGIRTRVVDRNVDASPLQLDGVDLVGFSINASNIDRSLASMRALAAARPGLPIAAGGPACMGNPGFFMRHAPVQAVAVCEADDALYDYLTASDPERVPGFYLRRGDEWVFTGHRPWITDLDRLPFPDLSRVPLRRYRAPVGRRRPMSSIITSRGCPARCTFCLHVGGFEWRPRSPENVVAELEYQVREFGVKEVCIDDDNFTRDLNRARAICDLIVERGLRLSLQLRAGIRADHLDEDLVRRLKRAGVWLVSLSPESGSPETLRRIRKGFRLEDVKRAVGMLKREGLVTFACYMLGFPWETEAELRETVEFALELDTDFIQAARVRAWHGTDLFHQVEFLVDPEEVFRDTGLFCGELTHRVAAGPEAVEAALVTLHRRFYGPRRALRILRVLPLSAVLRLALFSLITGNL